VSVAPFVETLVKMLVMEPDTVRVEEKNDRGTWVYNVHVAPEDVGRLIGKDGRVISCVRMVVGSVAAKARMRSVVKVVAD
jgi:predicted RNA-binding protein YlqC (UPF0109 family)